MLIEFSVGNYRSFKEVVTLSMVATKLTSRNKLLDEHHVFTAPDDKTRLLTSAVIYGANASGKSNLIRAFTVMRQMVLDSAHKLTDGERIAVEPFRLALSTREQPSVFEIIFCHTTAIYRYGFAATPERIVQEWLYHTPHGKSREARLFERTADAPDTPLQLARGVFKEGRRAFASTRPNALYLSVLADTFNDPTALQITRWFRRNVQTISGLRDGSKPLSLECLEAGHEHRAAVLAFFQQLDLAITDIHIKTEAIDFDALAKGIRIPMARSLIMKSLREDPNWQRVEVKTVHQVYDDAGQPIATELFDLDQHESDGTQKLFALAAPIVVALQQGLLLVIDEFDARLHPLMTRALMQLFNDPRTNPHHAQLIFTTHDTTLLDPDLLRRDQIWFMEKNEVQATLLVALAEFKVRNDAPFARDYLTGGYGAVPYIGRMLEFKEDYVTA